jgi:hypothetical protein
MYSGNEIILSFTFAKAECESHTKLSQVSFMLHIVQVYHLLNLKS